MSKKTALFIAAALVVAAAAAYLLFPREPTVISTENNVVTVKGTRGGRAGGGSGVVAVGEGEHLHLTYALTRGSFDVTFAGLAGEQNENTFPMEALNGDTPATLLSGDPFGETGLEGNGSLDFAVQPGEYMAFFHLHHMTGEATLSAQAD